MKVYYLLMFVLTSICSYAQECDHYPRPVPGQRVYDLYNKIDDVDESYLQDLATRFEDSTGFQMAIITLQDLGGQDEFSYAQGLGNCWGVGEREVDNGLLVIVSFEDRTWRIHTGRKTEIYLPDHRASGIGYDVLLPQLKDGNPSTAIRNTVQAVVDHLGWESWEERERVRLLHKEQQAQAMKRFLFAGLQLLLFLLGGIFSWLFVRNTKIQNRIKKQIKSWEAQLLAPSQLYNTTDWPEWAKEDLRQFQDDYDEEFKKYILQKEKFLKQLQTRPKHAEEQLPKLEYMYSNLIAIARSSLKIQKDITRYQTNAGLQMEHARLEVDKLHTFLSLYREEGYVLSTETSAVDAFWLSLAKAESNLQQAEKDPDAFKKVYEESGNIALRASRLKESLSELFLKKRLLDESIPKMSPRIHLLEAEYKGKVLKKLTSLQKEYPAEVSHELSVKYEAVPKKLSLAANKFNDALVCNSLEKQEFTKAFVLYTEASEEIGAVEELFRNISAVLESQQDAEIRFSALKTSTHAAIQKVVSKCNHADVTAVTKKRVNFIQALYDVAVSLSETLPVNWVKGFEKMKDANALAEAVYTQALQDIEEAEYKRKKKREAEQAEQADKEKRRRQSYSSSSSGWGSSSSSGRSYGGGSFGGGGAGGRW